MGANGTSIFALVRHARIPSVRTLPPRVRGRSQRLHAWAGHPVSERCRRPAALKERIHSAGTRGARRISGAAVAALA